MSRIPPAEFRRVYELALASSEMSLANVTQAAVELGAQAQSLTKISLIGTRELHTIERKRLSAFGRKPEGF